MTNIADNCEFEIITGTRSVLGKEWCQNTQASAFGRIYCIESGTGFVQHHSRRFTLRPGNAYLIPSHSELSFGCPNKIIICWMHFSAFTEDGADLFDMPGCRYEIRPPESLTAMECLQSLLEKEKANSIGDDFRRRALLLQLFSPFLSKCVRDAVPHAGLLRFRPVLKLIDENISGRLRISSLAMNMNMRPETFSRSFSSCFGTSPSQYVQRKKMATARQLLSDTGRKLQDIAEELGFTDAFHFSKTFKRLTGKSPREFRNSRMDPMP